MRRAPASVVLATMMLAACTRRERDGSAADASADAAPALSAKAPASSAGRDPAFPLEPSSATALRAPSPAPSSRVSVDAAIAPSSSWEWRTYRGDHFSALFPGDPKLTELPAEDDKIGYTEAHLDMPGGQVSFAAGFSEHTKEDVAKPEELLDKVADAPRRGLTDVLHKRSITLPGGHPGRVLILRRNISGTPLRVYSRLHLVGRRLYSLIVSTLDVGGVGEDVVKKFMESFKVF
jgi:hypothetical protein